MVTADRLKYYMKLKKIKSAMQLSDMSGVPYRTIQDILKGADPRLGTMNKIVKGLGVPLSEFYGDAGYENEDLAAHRADNGEGDLPEEAVKSIEDFKNFIRKKYKKQD